MLNENETLQMSMFSPLGYETPTADSFVASLDKDEVAKYTEYWQSIQPKNHADYFRRWLFSLMSVHTTWESNVRGYNFLKDLSWLFDKDKLATKVVDARVGLHTNRIKAVWQLFDQFHSNVDDFYRQENESWSDFRDRLVDKVFMLGYAKTTFPIGMSFPLEADIVCLDVHFLRLLGWKKKTVPSKRDYHKIEKYWVDLCRSRDFAPSVVREMYWDKVQGQDDSRYWSYCLESNNGEK